MHYLFPFLGTIIENSSRLFSPIQYVGPDKIKFGGNFSFPFRKSSNDQTEIFAPIFHLHTNVYGLPPIERIVSIYGKEKLSSSTVHDKSSFCTTNDKVLDMRLIFSSGLIGSCDNREVFFSGELLYDCFLPNCCVTDTGIIFQWPHYKQPKNEQVALHSIKELMEKTKAYFAAFPKEKLLTEHMVWKFIRDRQVMEVPKEFLKPFHAIEERRTGTLYLGINV